MMRGFWASFTWRRHSGISVCPALEAVTLAQHCLDMVRLLWVFAESATNLADRGVDATVGVEVDIFAPEALDDLLAADQSPIFAD
jgi:hypothetical protein